MHVIQLWTYGTPRETYQLILLFAFELTAQDGSKLYPSQTLLLCWFSCFPKWIIFCCSTTAIKRSKISKSVETLWLSQGSLLEDIRAIDILSSKLKMVSGDPWGGLRITTKTGKQIDGIRDGCRPVNSFSRCCPFQLKLYFSFANWWEKIVLFPVCLTFQLKTKEQVSTLKMVPFGCFVKNHKAPFPSNEAHSLHCNARSELKAECVTVWRFNIFT